MEVGRDNIRCVACGIWLERKPAVKIGRVMHCRRCAIKVIDFMRKLDKRFPGYKPQRKPRV